MPQEEKTLGGGRHFGNVVRLKTNSLWWMKLSQKSDSSGWKQIFKKKKETMTRMGFITKQNFILFILIVAMTVIFVLIKQKPTHKTFIDINGNIFFRDMTSYVQDFVSSPSPPIYVIVF